MRGELADTAGPTDAISVRSNPARKLRLAAMCLRGFDEAADLAEIGQRDGIDPPSAMSSMAATMLASAALGS
jgi:hypothetical protein